MTIIERRDNVRARCQNEFMKKIVTKICAAALCGMMITSSLPLDAFANDDKGINLVANHSLSWGTDINYYLDLQPRKSGYTWEEINKLLNEMKVATCTCGGEVQFAPSNAQQENIFNGIDFSKNGDANFRIKASHEGTELFGTKGLYITIADTEVPTVNIPDEYKTQTIAVADKDLTDDQIIPAFVTDKVEISDNSEKEPTVSLKDRNGFNATQAGEYDITFVATDDSNNETTFTIKVIVSDKDMTAPEVVNVSYSPSKDKPTNQSVTVVVEFNEEVSMTMGWKPVKESGSVNMKKWTKVFAENGDEGITFTDNSGNTGNYYISVNHIDKVTPIVENVSFSEKGITNQSILVVLTFSEEVNMTMGWQPVKESDVLNMKKWQKVFQENGTHTVNFTDEANNKGEYTFTINTIDKVSPEVSVSLSTNDFTNENVTATIQSKEPISVDGWTKVDEYTYKKVYETNVTEQVIVKDAAGNTTKVDVIVDIIDRQAPEISVTTLPNTPTTEDVVVKISANEPITISAEGWVKVSEDGTLWQKTFTANGQEDVVVVDRAGNEVETTVVVKNIDRVAPTVTIQYDYKQIAQGSEFTAPSAFGSDENAPYTLKAELDSIYYGETKETTETKVEAVDTSKLGWYKLTYKAVDMAGNVGTADCYIEVVDEKAPTVTIQYDHTQVEKGSEFKVPSAFGSDENAPYTLKAELVGIYVGETEETTETEVDSVDTSKLGWYKLTYKAVDAAGNVGTADCYVEVVDTTAPEVLDVEYSSKDMTYNNVVVTITYNEPVEIKAEGWKAINEEKTIWEKEYKTNATEEVVAADPSGNTVSTKVLVSNIDKEHPVVVTVEYSKTELTNEDVTVKLIFNEAVNVTSKGWEAVETTRALNNASKVWVKTFAENGSENVEAKDIAGNAMSIEVKVSNIDKIAPVIEGVEDGKVYNEAVSAQVSDENLAKVMVNGVAQDLASLNLTFDQTGEYTLSVVDKAGNVTEVTFKVEIAEENNGTVTPDDNNNDSSVETADHMNLVYPMATVITSFALFIALYIKKTMRRSK